MIDSGLHPGVLLTKCEFDQANHSQHQASSTSLGGSNRLRAWQPDWHSHPVDDSSGLLEELP
ncbi:hypothetical protein [Neorhodopirellula lusitana]|uniref:hypothetical protein n=1 Tax=Neorhodopirellula lusitana TaxID=445327 RepID=UPI0024B84F33|nr:hypothetical protein [Neorhodopirellula lusitana]